MSHLDHVAASIVIESPVGPLTLGASSAGLACLLFGREPLPTGQDPAARDRLDAAARQLAEYFAGTRQDFDVVLDPRGTPFQLAAWQALRTIPFGQTISYGEQAARLGCPAAARAVGAANGANPISIIVPCHRVVGASGRLVGFGGGLAAKRYLLNLEALTGTLFP